MTEGESENKSIGSRRAVSLLGGGSEVFETGLEMSEGNWAGGAGYNL
jgi:hypothetical protein